MTSVVKQARIGHTFLFSVCAAVALWVHPVCGGPNEMDLAGPWLFRIDRQDEGIEQQWFNDRLPQRIALPGSIQEQGFGDDVGPETSWTGNIRQQEWKQPRYDPYRKDAGFKIPFWLQPEKYYKGPAWFQRTVTVPSGWMGKRIVLHLERCHWETTVWVDGKKVGSQNSLSTPHQYDLTFALVPGSKSRKQHTLTIRVDNRVNIDVGDDAHSVSDHTQSNWNGIVGKLHLKATDRVWIDDIQVYPDLANRTAKVKVTLGNLTRGGGRGTLSVRAASFNTGESHAVTEKQIPIQFGAGDRSVVVFDYPMGSDVQAWDEFHPALYRMTLELNAETREVRHKDTASVTFGMRKLATKGTQFVLNGRPIMLRGTLECAIFPLTGYPPTNVDGWKDVMRVCQKHGLNHIRFHSNCPPEAAFTAADELGFYFQVEGPFWTSVGNGGETDRYIRAECDRILQAYGNHPSFMLMAYGNEPGGNEKNRFLGDLVNHWKEIDSRHLYTSASGWPIIPENQFHVSPKPRIHQWGQGLKCRINARSPETVTDYRKFIQRFDVPVVSHEIGQWCAYPDFDEIKKYTGVLKAKNFEVFRDILQNHHMSDQARDFLMASGKLQTICYKEEIESALRTPGFGGFQLLDLHDFPGQGTALVGVLDPFWNSKPYVTPAEYRRFCNRTVPLALLAKRTYTNDENFAAEIEVSHFGSADLREVTLPWKLVDLSGKIIEKGLFQVDQIVTGGLTKVGRLSIPLRSVHEATKLKLFVAIQGTDIENDWDLWVYPTKVSTAASGDVLLTHDLDESAVARLKAGGKVLLQVKSSRVKTDAVLGFSTVFWNTAWTNNQPPHTMGILCDPRHPALARFPTEFHTNWQWWELVHQANAMVLDGLPASLRPTVQVIDTWFSARRLGLAFEANLLGGKLLVTSIDLETDLDQRHVARQMRHSLLQYMASDQFKPVCSVSIDQVHGLFRQPSALTRLGASVTADCHQPGYPPSNAIDDDPQTIWHTNWDPAVPHPHHLVIDLRQPLQVKGIQYTPRQDMANGRIGQYEVYVSSDAKQWGEPVASGVWPNDAKPKTVSFTDPISTRYVKLQALSEVNQNGFSSVAEVTVFLGR